jgi:hypothetical protein
MLQAQGIRYDWQDEHWGALFFTHKLNEKFSIWHDYHFATKAFVIIRPGVSYHFNANNTLTGGYAFVSTATPFSDRINRYENRLWLQFEQRIPYENKLIFRNRFRYEGRWRQALGTNEILDDIVFNHRLRYMGSVRIFLRNKPNKINWHINTMAELLWFVPKDLNLIQSDQNRYYLLPGFTKGSSVLMLGYYARLLPPSGGRQVIKNGVCMWYSHNF